MTSLSKRIDRSVLKDQNVLNALKDSLALRDRLSRIIVLSQSLKHNRLFVLLFACLCLSCESGALYDQYQPIDGTSWGKDKVYYFSFEITDSTVPYDLTLEIRNNNLYPYQNLWIFYNEEQPIGPQQRDTLECMLADEFGKWHGHGISLYQSSFPIRSNYRFPHAGQYTFGFRQGMRDEALTGIQEIGFRVEKVR